MKKILFTLCALVCAYLCAAPQVSAQASSSGTYTTYIGPQPIATENYALTVSPDGSRRSEADVTLGPNKTKFVTVVSPQNRPVSFTAERDGARLLGVEFVGSTARLSTAGRAPRVVATAATVVLENLVWHHLIFLLAQYDAARAGAQTFKAFLPGQELTFDVTVERKATPSFDVDGRRVATEQYNITLNGLPMEVWTDVGRVPLVGSVPAQGVRIVAKNSEPLASLIFPATKASTNENFSSEEVTFSNGGLKLAGTLTIPKRGAAPFPAAVIITGSGGQDRDGETGVMGLYRLIAERLSENGVAVLRADDRGVGKSDVPTKPSSYRDFVEDSRAALAYLTTRPEIDKTRIALIGHSEGAETATIIAGEDTRVAAIALLAGPSRPVDRIALEQALFSAALNRTVDPSDTTKLPELSREILRLFEEARTKPAPASGAPDTLAWFREHAASDPLVSVRRVRCPVLILQGERDSLVLPHHALALASALTESGNRRVALRIFPGLTHLFTSSTPDANASTDKTPQVSRDFLQTLAAWMAETLKRPATP